MRPARIIVLSLLAVALLSVASASGGGETSPPGSTSNPLVAVPNPMSSPVPGEQPPNEGPRDTDGGAAKPSNPTSTKTQQGTTALHLGEPMAAQPQTTRQQKEQTPSAGRPCSLISRAEAQQIIGVPIVEPLEAPQGPTCIYRTQSANRYVTLAAQAASIEQLREQVRDPAVVSIAGRTGYCGAVGGPVLYVSLAQRRTLVVTAACDTAKRLAALAIGRADASLTTVLSGDGRRSR